MHNFALRSPYLASDAATSWCASCTRADRKSSAVPEDNRRRLCAADSKRIAQVFLLGQAEVPYAELAREMSTAERALKVAIHRLRKRYRALFLREIRETVADPAEVDSEIRFLFLVPKRGK